MAKINLNEVQRSQEFSKLCAKQQEIGEYNDCTVKAISLTCQISYEEAHALLKQLGRKDRHGFRLSCNLDKVATALGVQFVRKESANFIRQYPGCHKNLNNVTTYHPHRFNEVWKDGKTYLVFTRGHVLAVIDGKTHDWTDNKAKQVISIYEVVK